MLVVERRDDQCRVRPSVGGRLGLLDGHALARMPGAGDHRHGRFRVHDLDHARALGDAQVYGFAVRPARHDEVHAGVLDGPDERPQRALVDVARLGKRGRERRSSPGDVPA